jgi:hypothetical protein
VRLQAQPVELPDCAQHPRGDLHLTWLITCRPRTLLDCMKTWRRRAAIPRAQGFQAEGLRKSAAAPAGSIGLTDAQITLCHKVDNWRRRA